jgi:hypothetical protein
MAREDISFEAKKIMLWPFSAPKKRYLVEFLHWDLFLYKSRVREDEHEDWGEPPPFGLWVSY